jgi:hypothetical protein
LDVGVFLIVASPFEVKLMSNGLTLATNTLPSATARRRLAGIQLVAFVYADPCIRQLSVGVVQYGLRSRLRNLPVRFFQEIG